MSYARFQKQQRERARLDKARAKRARREDRSTQGADEETPTVAPLSEPDVLEQLAALHQQFEADEIDFDEFEQRKHELLAQLHV